MKRIVLCVALSLLAALTLSPVARAENWPQWRGPDNNGISSETKLPTAWSDTKNIAWKLPMPGRAGSTPAIWGDRIFLTSTKGKDLVLLCVSTGGKILWERQLGSGSKIHMSGQGDDASNSPSTDGKHVFASSGTGDLGCFDLDGKDIWKINLQDRYGKFKIQHGFHITPLLEGDRLYVVMLHNGGHWIVALDKANGKEIWKVARPTDAVGESREAYSSPVLWTTAKGKTLVVEGCDYVTGHSLEDGKELWRLGDINPKKNYVTAGRVIPSPVASPDLLVAAVHRNGLIIALKPNPSGFIGAGSPFEQWRKPKGGPDVPSPLIHDGLLYLVQADKGILQCWDVKTGKEHYYQRIHEHIYRASPVYADGKIYMTSRDGVTRVVKAGPEFVSLSENRLGENITASPAISGGRIYMRGYENLYAIQEGAK